VLIDLGHHAQGVNIEQIVACSTPRAGSAAFHFNNRKYADDDLIVGSVNPFELFLIFVELAASEASAAGDDSTSRTTVEAKVEAMVLFGRDPAGGVRKGAACRPRRAAPPPEAGDVLGGHEVCSTPTTRRPRSAPSRRRAGRAENPIRAARSGYAPDGPNVTSRQEDP
jgi:L-rhamnose isomerase/sugar isomerase